MCELIVLRKNHQTNFPHTLSKLGLRVAIFVGEISFNMVDVQKLLGELCLKDAREFFYNAIVVSYLTADSFYHSYF